MSLKGAKRKGNSRRKRKAIIAKGTTDCYWCGKPLTLDTSTLEHIIPISRGGLDHHNNTTIACVECNGARGSNMPELA